MTRILLIAAVAVLSLGSLSCKKSGGGGPTTTPTGKSVFIKLTLSPAVLPGQDNLSGAVNAVLPGTSGLATWKVNGVTRTNESTIAFTQADFKNGVITLETTAGVTSANLALSAMAINQTSYTIVVETTLDGKAQDPVSIPVTSTLQRSFTYF